MTFLSISAITTFCNSCEVLQHLQPFPTSLCSSLLHTLYYSLVSDLSDCGVAHMGLEVLLRETLDLLLHSLIVVFCFDPRLLSDHSV